MVTKVKHGKANKKTKSPTATSSKQSYENMRGSPMNVADHPARVMPDPSGGAFQGMGISNLMPGGSPPSMGDYGV